MDIVQTFYHQLADHYDKLFQDWDASVREQAQIISRLIAERGFERRAQVLDCACGIGTQAIGLAALGFSVTASDISERALAQAEARAAARHVQIRFARADFRALPEVFPEQFDLVIAMDNAIPHMLTADDLRRAVQSMTGRVRRDGLLIASIRDYDLLLEEKPPYSPPYIHRTENGQRVAFQTWQWHGRCCRLVQYIIEDGDTLHTSKFECEYRAVRRAELTELLEACGCSGVQWLMPEESGYYQPVVIARKA